MGTILKAMKMEERMRRLLEIVLMAVLLAPAASFGQSRGGPVCFDVPFAFVIAGQQLPAGQYSVSLQTGSVVRLFQPNGRNTFTLTHRGGRSDELGGKLTFHRYGDAYFLASVSVADGGVVHELYPTSTELSLRNHQVETELAVVSSLDKSPAK
jgi:hypothetical protein